MALGFAAFASACDDSPTGAPAPLELTVSPKEAHLQLFGDPIDFEAIVSGGRGTSANLPVSWFSTDTLVLRIFRDSGRAVPVGTGHVLVYAYIWRGDGPALSDTASAIVENPLLQARTGDFQLQEVTPEELWFRGYGLIDTTSYPQDAAGVRLDERGGRLNYHPVGIAQNAFHLLDSFRATTDSAFLRLAINHADRLLAEADVGRNGGLFFPYTFDFRLHSSTRPEDLMVAPWYSGMAQGMALSLMARLYKITGEDKYLTAGAEILKSLWSLRGKTEPFVAEIDDNSDYWIEEYAQPIHRNLVLNGFNFAIYGVYEYLQVTTDPLARQLLQAALATLKEHVEQYRVVGGLSYYCLRHKAQATTYHQIHIV